MDEKLDPQEIQEVLHEKAAKSSAVVLETVCRASSIYLPSSDTREALYM